MVAQRQAFSRGDAKAGARNGRKGLRRVFSARAQRAFDRLHGQRVVRKPRRSRAAGQRIGYGQLRLRRKRMAQRLCGRKDRRRTPRILFEVVGMRARPFAQKGRRSARLLRRKEGQVRPCGQPKRRRLRRVPAHERGLCGCSRRRDGALFHRRGVRKIQGALRQFDKRIFHRRAAIRQPFLSVVAPLCGKVLRKIRLRRISKTSLPVLRFRVERGVPLRLLFPCRRYAEHRLL